MAVAPKAPDWDYLNDQPMSVTIANAGGINKLVEKEIGLIERDPNGRRANEPGAKLDSGKVKAHLMLSGFSLALREVAKVTTYGAEKYSPNGWLEVPDGEQRYADAMMRHILLSVREPFDAESKLSHIAHAAWNVLAILELELRKEVTRKPLYPPTV